MERDIKTFHQVSESKGWECTLIAGVFHNKHMTFFFFFLMEMYASHWKITSY